MSKLDRKRRDRKLERREQRSLGAVATQPRELRQQKQQFDRNSPVVEARRAVEKIQPQTYRGKALNRPNKVVNSVSPPNQPRVAKARQETARSPEKKVCKPRPTRTKTQGKKRGFIPWC